MKFLKNELEIFKIKNPVLHLFLLRIRVIFDSTLDYVNKSWELSIFF